MARVLVVDDDPHVLNVIMAMLRQGGHVAEGCINPREAHDLIRDVEHPLDVLVTDIVMPGRDGLEILLAARQARPRLPVIAISGGGGTEYRDSFLQIAAGMGAITLAKPIQADALAAAIAQALGTNNGKAGA